MLLILFACFKVDPRCLCLTSQLLIVHCLYYGSFFSLWLKFTKKSSIQINIFCCFQTFQWDIATMTAIAYFSLALELYFSISRPFWHRTKLTRKVCRYWIVLTWVFHYTFQELTLTFILEHTYEGVLIVVYSAIFFFIIQSLNLATFVSLRKQSQAMQQQRDEATMKALKARQRNEKRFLTTIAILSITMTVCFCPYFVYKILVTFPHLAPDTNYNVWEWLGFLTHCLIVINAMINPFFYLWRLPKYKKTFKELYCKCLRQHWLCLQYNISEHRSALLIWRRLSNACNIKK